MVDNTMPVSIDTGERKYTVNITLGSCPIYCRRDDIYVSDYGLDTVYRFQEGNFYPYRVTKYAEEKVPNTLFRHLLFKTDRYTVFKSVKKLIEERQFDVKDIVIDDARGEIFEANFMNGDYVSQKRLLFHNHSLDLPINLLVRIIQTIDLLDDYEAGELKEIASNMKEDDNPILMVVKFKE